MVEAGETGGILDIILQRLSTFIEKIVKLKRDIISAMIYPSAVVLLAIAAVAVIMVVVIPQFQQIFIGLLGPGEQLPLPTRIVVGISISSPVGADWLSWSPLSPLLWQFASTTKQQAEEGLSISCYSRCPFLATSFARLRYPDSHERCLHCFLPVCRYCSRWTSQRRHLAT